MCYPFRILLFLLLSSPVLRAIEPSDIARIVGNSDVSVSITGANEGIVENQIVFLEGESSLAFQALEINGSASLEYAIDFTVPGPGLFEFYTKMERSGLPEGNLSYVRLNFDTGNDRHIRSTVVDGWTRHRFYSTKVDEQLRVQLEGNFFEGHQLGLSFLLDKAQFHSGYQIDHTINSDYGTISISPQKSFYEIGEIIEFSITPIEDHRVQDAGRTERSPQGEEYFRYEKEDDNVFTLKGHNSITSAFERRLDIGELHAWAPVREADPILEYPDGSFQAPSLVIEGDFRTGILSFEARSTGEGVVYISNTQEESFLIESELAFETIKAVVSPTEMINFNLDEIAIRNIAFDSTPQALITVLGKGVVGVEYEPGEEPGTRVATITATPDSGWEFNGWSDGLESKQSQLKFILDKPVAITAHFAQVFRFGATRWAFVHDGRAQIATSDGSGNEPLISIHTSGDPVFVELELTVFEHGPAEILERFPPPNATLTPEFEPLYIPQLIHNNFARTTPLIHKKSVRIRDSKGWEIGSIITGGGYDSSDVGLEIIAPANAVNVNPDDDRLYIGQKVELSVREDFPAKFLGWRGDFYSNEPSIEFDIQDYTKILAVFESEYTTQSGDFVTLRGPALAAEATSDRLYAFETPLIPPGAWTEIQFGLSDPLVLEYSFERSSSLLELSFWHGNTLLETLDTHESGTGRYIELPSGTQGDLRLFAKNLSPEPHTLRFEATGYFQKAVGGGSSRRDFDGGTVSLPTPYKEYYQVGSSVSIIPEPDTGFDFVGWNSPNISKEESMYTVLRDEAFVIDAVFEPNFGTDKLMVKNPLSPGWRLTAGPNVELVEPISGDTTQSLEFSIEGPGIFVFDIYETAPFWPGDATQAIVRINGTPISLGTARSQTFEPIYEALIPSGLHDVEIEVSLIPEAAADPLLSSFGVYSRIEDIKFTEGYVIRKRYENGLDFDINPEPVKGVYAEGQTVTLMAQVPSPGTFSDWNGPLVGSPASVDVVVNQHILTNPTTEPLSSLGPITITVAPGTLHSFVKSQDGLQATLQVESEAGPSTVSFEVPAMTELAFQLSTSPTPIRILSNSNQIYEGIPENAFFGIPAKPVPQDVIFELAFDPQNSNPVRFENMVVSQDFELEVRNFDLGNAQVAIEPEKGRYLPGETVSIKLGEDVPEDWVFYDALLSYPNLSTLDWLPTENVRSLEIEMLSNADLLVATGPPPQRNTGDLIVSSELRVVATDQQSPDGTFTNTWRINPSPSPNFIRVRTSGVNRANFWARIPVRQTWIFSETLYDEEPLMLEGNGAWRQLSIAVDSDLDYFSIFVLIDGSDAIEFQLSDITLTDQAGPSFASTGNGTIHFSQNFELEARPNIGYRFLSWGSSIEITDPIFDFQDLENTVLFPIFASSPPLISLDGFEFESAGKSPTIVSNSVTPIAIDFKERGEAIATTLEGPATFSYNATSIGDGGLSVFLDNDIIHTHGGIPAPSSESPTIAIPSGVHRLEFRYSEFDPGDSTRIDDLSIANTISIKLGESEFGHFEIVPDKQFYDIGERVSITARPIADHQFSRWIGDIESEQPNLQFRATDHLDLEGVFSYVAMQEHQEMEWQILTELSNQPISHAKTVLQGPGLLRITESRFLDFNADLTIDGATLPAIVEDGERYMPIPSGEHFIEYFGEQDFRDVLNSFSYKSGFAIIRTGNSSPLMLDPIRDSYPDGSTVSIKWAHEYGPSPGSILRINGENAINSLPIELDIEKHIILDVEYLTPFSNTGFYSNAESEIRIGNGGLPFAQPLSFEFEKDLDTKNTLFNQYIQGGILRYQATGIGTRNLEAYIDGIKVDSIETDGTYSLRIPPNGSEIQWRMLYTKRNGPDGSIFLRDFNFQEVEYSEFENWISQYTPAHVFALSDRLGPLDDLDLDGISNSMERSKGLDPYLFTFDASIRIGENLRINPLEIEFETEIEVETSRVSVLSNVSSYWLSFPLENLQFEISLNEKGKWEYTLPIEQIGTGVGLFRIGILPAD